MDLSTVLEGFRLPAGQKKAVPFGNGHINHTYLVTAEGVRDEFILQRVNSYVFNRPLEVMENIAHVTDYLRAVIAEEGGDPERETMRLIPAADGSYSVPAEDGDVWRVFLRVPDAVSPEHPDSTEMLRECGRAFGLFSRRLRGFPADTLHESIPSFHDTPVRLAQLKEAMERDSEGRLKDVGDEIAFVMARADRTGQLVNALKEGKLPLRVTHNDTKVNNMLVDIHTGKAICVVDLDTVMPGLMAYDFGEGVRVGASSADEDERDLNRIWLDLPRYGAFARGFLAELREGMDRRELESLAVGPWMMTFENGMRFLADHLNGDKYFRIHRPGQNLDRARAQFALAADMEKKQDEMTNILLSI